MMCCLLLGQGFTERGPEVRAWAFPIRTEVGATDMAASLLILGLGMTSYIVLGQRSSPSD